MTTIHFLSAECSGLPIRANIGREMGRSMQGNELRFYVSPRRGSLVFLILSQRSNHPKKPKAGFLGRVALGHFLPRLTALHSRG